jgi:hypothetical protein
MTLYQYVGYALGSFLMLILVFRVVEAIIIFVKNAMKVR